MGLGPDGGISAAVGKPAVDAQTHGGNGHARLLHGPVQLFPLLLVPVQTGQTLIRLVDGDLHIVIAQFPGGAQPLHPVHGGGEGFLIQAQQMFSQHIVFSFSPQRNSSSIFFIIAYSVRDSKGRFAEILLSEPTRVACFRQSFSVWNDAFSAKNTPEFREVAH